MNFFNKFKILGMTIFIAQLFYFDHVFAGTRCLLGSGNPTNDCGDDVSTPQDNQKSNFACSSEDQHIEVKIFNFGQTGAYFKITNGDESCEGPVHQKDIWGRPNTRLAGSIVATAYLGQCQVKFYDADYSFRVTRSSFDASIAGSVSILLDNGNTSQEIPVLCQYF